MRRYGAAALRWLILSALWEIAGRFRLVADGALPAPSAILVQAWTDRDIYPAHIIATLLPASIGFLIGNAIAVAAAVAFVLSPGFERLMRLVGIAIFAIPAIALAPVLVITLRGDGPQIALAAISVYFSTMVATLLGLREVDPRPIDVIRSYGGGGLAVLRWVRWRSALPAMLGGFRLAAPAAVLGAILAEFGSGARWGLGSFLLGSLGRANPARLWGIGLAATLLAGTAYAVFSWAGQRLARGNLPTTIAVGQPPAPAGRGGPILILGACIMPFLLWQAVLSALGISPVIARTPLMVLRDLTIAPSAAATRAVIGGALAQSLPLAAAGLALGLGSALLLAMAGVLRPRLTSALMPLALVLQTMPLVALTPLIVLLFGRDIAATLVITVSVTMFPAFITIAQGLAQVPRPARDLFSVYGATRWQVLLLAALPGALPYLSAAARLVAPRALLGVMIAEYLATGYGLGNLLNEARGELDYGMIWAVTFVSAAISVGFYLAVEAVELRLLGRFRAG